MSAPSTAGLVSTPSGRWLLAGQGLDNLGWGLMTVALPWFVLTLGGSPGLAGAAVALEAVPYAIGGVVAGAIADLLPIRRMLASGYFAMAVFASVIPIWSRFEQVPLPALFVFPLLVGTARLMSDSAAIGAVAGIVGPARFVDGQSNLMAAWSLGILVGPGLAGALIAARGPVAALSFECVAYALAGALALRVTVPRSSLSPRTSLFASIKSGVNFVAHNATIKRLILISASRGLLTGGLFAMLVPLLHGVEGLPSTIVGPMLSVGALTALAVTPFIGRLARRLGFRNLIAGGLAITGLSASALSVRFAIPLLFIAIAAFYGGQFVTQSALTGARQQRAPLDSQSRVGMTARVIEKSAWVSGAMITSALAAPVGLRPIYFVLGLILATVGGLVAIGLSRQEQFGLRPEVYPIDQ